MKVNLPTQVTLSRLALAIIFFALLSQYSQREPDMWILDVGFAIFIVAAATDIVDGYLARKKGMVTDLGRVLDPFVDKVLVCGTFILYTGPGFVDTTGRNATEVQAWMVVVIVGRELLVTGLRGFSESKGCDFSASLYGKVKMWMQSIAAPGILLLIAHEDWFGAATAIWMKRTLVWLTVIVTALSTIQYLARSRQLLEGGAGR